MGALLSIPLLTGGVASLGSAIFSGCMVFMGEPQATRKAEILTLKGRDR